MEDITSKITNTISDTFNHVVETSKERFFTPMYFYFFIAWVVANWKFVYVLLFVNEDTIVQNRHILKIDYLSQMYGVNWESLLHLIIIPAITSFVIIWWLSRLSEKFFEKYEEHQMNKRVIKRDIEYREKAHYFSSEREIREQEFDKKIKYEDNTDFNDWIDDLEENKEPSMVLGVPMVPSEVLYNTDYEAYKEKLEEWENEQIQKGEDLAAQEEIDRRRGK